MPVVTFSLSDVVRRGHALQHSFKIGEWERCRPKPGAWQESWQESVCTPMSARASECRLAPRLECAWPAYGVRGCCRC